MLKRTTPMVPQKFSTKETRCFLHHYLITYLCLCIYCRFVSWFVLCDMKLDKFLSLTLIISDTGSQVVDFICTICCPRQHRGSVQCCNRRQVQRFRHYTKYCQLEPVSYWFLDRFVSSVQDSSFKNVFFKQMQLWFKPLYSLKYVVIPDQILISYGVTVSLASLYECWEMMNLYLGK